MFSSPVFYAWLAWFLVVAVFATIRYKTRQREEQQREERRRQREARQGQRAIGAVRHHVRRSALPADYRDQLTLAPVLALRASGGSHSASAGVAAGIIKPATEPENTDLATNT